jgi:hypothetical protein
MRQYGVIFIDCWDQDWAEPNFYPTIKERLANLPVAAKVFNTSFMRLDIITQETVNYLKTFPQPKSVQDLLDNAGTERLSRHLYDELDSKSILIPSLEGFIQYVQMSGISHWIVMGAHWGLCTHTKPLGFDNLLAYKRERPHMNFYAIPECIAKWVHGPDENIATTCTWDDFKDDRLTWSRVGNMARLEL